MSAPDRPLPADSAAEVRRRSIPRQSLDISQISGLALVKLTGVLPDVPQKDSRIIDRAIAAEAERRGWPEGWEWNTSALTAEQLGTEGKSPELACSNCGWQGARGDLARDILDPDGEPPGCPSCSLPFEGLDDEGGAG